LAAFEVEVMRCIEKLLGLITVISLLSACVVRGGMHGNPVDGVEEVRSTELEFAKAMADRDFGAFVKHLSADAVFFDDRHIDRGANEVSVAWKPLFDGAKAPFSWVPDHVEVLRSGDLALSTGPVMVGDRVVARFNSIWRLEAPHTWRIVFDKGESAGAGANK
jgi:ketosteroid isomerase-like protein